MRRGLQPSSVQRCSDVVLQCISARLLHTPACAYRLRIRPKYHGPSQACPGSLRRIVSLKPVVLPVVLADSEQSKLLTLVKPWLIETIRASFSFLTLPEHLHIPIELGAADVYRPHGILKVGRKGTGRGAVPTAKGTCNGKVCGDQPVEVSDRTSKHNIILSMTTQPDQLQRPALLCDCPGVHRVRWQGAIHGPPEQERPILQVLGSATGGAQDRGA